MKIVCEANMTLVSEAFATLGEVVALDGRQIGPGHLRDADILITRSTTRVNETLLGARRLRFYGSGVIGTDHIDIPFLERAGIPWCAAPGCNAVSVSQYIVSALVRFARRGGLRLDTLTLGVVGVGHVGRQVAARARALGMRVVASIRRRAHRRSSPQTCCARAISTLHVPLTRTGPYATMRLLDATRLSVMRPGARLINAARGPVIDSDAWLSLQARGRLGGTVLDTLDPEPAYRRDVHARVDWGTTHIAGHSYEGKVNGTLQVYRAACRVLGVAPAFTPHLPSPPVPEIEVDARSMSREALLERLVLPSMTCSRRCALGRRRYRGRHAARQAFDASADSSVCGRVQRDAVVLQNARGSRRDDA